MATHVLIIWPQSREAGLLCDALLRSGLGLRTRILQRYPDRSELAEALAGNEAPKAVVVGMTAQDRALQLLKDLDTDAPDLLKVAAHTEESAELLRAVMRTGASDFLAPPFSLAEIARTFEPVAAAPDERPEGALFAIMPCQGTDGASTIAVHLAHGLSAGAERPALLADCDVQCGVTAFRLGLQPKYTLADALANADRLGEVLDKIVLRWQGFDLICAPDSALGLMGDHLERLPKVLAAARKRYGRVICDLPPAIYSAGLEAMQTADKVLLVCTPDLTSLHLARWRLSDLLNHGVDKQRIWLVLNRSGSRRSVTPEDVGRAVGKGIESQLANDYEAAHRATLEGRLVSRETHLGKDLAELAAKLAGAPSGPDKDAKPGWKKRLGFG